MRSSQNVFEGRDNPVDLIERFASRQDWEFERPCDDEIAVAVAGRAADYSLSFSWMAECEALHIGCAFALVVPAMRELEVLRLLARVNEQLIVGHFDWWPAEGTILFRHSLLLAGGARATGAQAERMLEAALEACERFHAAFRFVAEDGCDGRAALAAALFETVGTA